MMTNDRIVRYLRFEMDAAEQAGLKAQLAEDPLLAEGLDGLQRWQAGSGRPIESMLNELGRLIDDILPLKQNGYQRRRKLQWKPILAAACLLGFLFIGHTFLTIPDPEYYFAHYFHPLTHPDMTLRGGTDTSQVNYATKAYETENYKQVIYHYRQLLTNEPGEEKYRLFLGIAYLANYQPDKAVETLLDPFTTCNEFEDDRQWYLALAYLRISNWTSAKALLNALSGSDTYYRDMAKELSAKLD